MIITTKLIIDLKLEVTQNFHLTGSVNNILFEVEEVKKLFDTPESVEDVQENIELLRDTVKGKLNHQLKKGFRIPIPEILIADFSSSDLVTFDKFLMIEGDPKIMNENIFTSSTQE